MPSITSVRDAFYAALKTYALSKSPVLRIEIAGQQFTPANGETWLRFFLRTANPSKPYAGTHYISKEAGFFQVDVLGPEDHLQKHFEAIAWEVREHFWPSNASIGPTIGSSPLIRLGPTAPLVRDHPAPGEGRLGSIVSIDWNSDFSRS